MIISMALLFASVASGQTLASEPSARAAEVQQADNDFWAAYNACDQARMSDAFTDDAEFYHDVTGLTLGRAAVVASLMNGPCGTSGQHLRREVVRGTVQSYPLAESYMFLTGEHLFHVRQGDGPERISAQARFADVWRWEAGRWRMARVISYDHGAPPYIPPSVDQTFDVARLPSFAGRYQSSDFGDVVISVEDRGLRMKSGNLSLALFPVSADRFASLERDLQLEFDGDRLTVVQGGSPVTSARREP
ncbi:MAG: nuclear transport factor 2 family protein [Brevundimonas sp.]